MSETLNNNDNSQCSSSESLTSIEQTLTSLKTDLRNKKQHIEIIRNIIHNDKVTYNSNIKKYLDLNQQIIDNEHEIENIDKQISSIIKKQKLFKLSLTKSFYINFKDAFNHLNVDKVITFFEFCGFNNVDERKCIMLKRMIKNEHELLYMLLHGEKHQKDLYKDEYNEFKYMKIKINETNKETLPYVYEQLFMYIVSVYNKIELHSIKEELMNVNDYHYEMKNKIFITLKQLEYAIVQNSRIYRQLYSYIKGAKLMLVNYNKIKHNVNKELVNDSATNSISHSNNSNNKNNYGGAYLNFVKCVKEFRKNHWRTNLFLSNEVIRSISKTHNAINNNINDNNTVIEHPGEIQNINDLSMSILSEFCDDEKSEISSVNRDLLDTHNNINVIYKNISLSKRNKTLSKSQIKNTKSRNAFIINTKHIKQVNNNSSNKKVICNKTFSNIKPILTKNIITKQHLTTTTTNTNSVIKTTPKKINYKQIRLIKSRTTNSLQKQASFSPSIIIISPNKISPLKCKTPSTNTPLRKYKKIKKTFVSRNERSNINSNIEHNTSNMNHTFQSSLKYENKSTKDESIKAHIISTSYDKNNITHSHNNNNNNNDNEQHNTHCVCDEMLSINTTNQLQLQITKIKHNKYININHSNKRKSFASNYSNIKIDPKIHKCDCCMSCT